MREELLMGMMGEGLGVDWGKAWEGEGGGGGEGGYGGRL